MSTWEERMSARAQERIRAEKEREDAIWRAQMDAEEAELEERYRPLREAGAPGGCHECWHWSRWPWGDGYSWHHGRSVQPGPPPDGLEAGSVLAEPDHDDWWCWHACHGGEPVGCAPVGYAAMG
jgi:hypothetical protein